MIPAETAAALEGKYATDAELSLLRSKFPPGAVPEWFITLLKDFRLGRAFPPAGIELVSNSLSEFFAKAAAG